MKKTVKNLITWSPSHLITSQKSAFTLAEVLITLAIIGVVAAMTIPTLISDYQEKVTVTKVKKMYSILSNAYQLHIADHGTPGHIEYSEEGAAAAFNIFAPYLKIAKDCGGDGTGCIVTGYAAKEEGRALVDYVSNTSYYKVVLNDSSTIWFRGGASESEIASGDNYDMDIMFDVNGIAGPNRWGYDLFDFLIVDGILYPDGTLGKTFYDDCLTSVGYGFGCAAWVIQKGNMDYLKCPDELTWADSKCPN